MPAGERPVSRSSVRTWAAVSTVTVSWLGASPGAPSSATPALPTSASGTASGGVAARTAPAARARASVSERASTRRFGPAVLTLPTAGGKPIRPCGPPFGCIQSPHREQALSGDRRSRVHRLQPGRRAGGARRPRARAGRLLDRAAREPGGGAGRRGGRGRPARRGRGTPRRRGGGRRVPPGGAPLRAALGRRPAQLQPGERDRDARPAPRLPRRGRAARGVRVVVLGLRRRPGASQGRDPPHPAGLALRDLEAGGGALLSDLRAPLRARDGEPALLQRLRATPEPGVEVFGRDP